MVRSASPTCSRDSVSETVRHLTTEQALQIARVAVSGPIAVRDLGLLDAAVNRPRASLFGQDAYPDVWHMAAALLH